MQTKTFNEIILDPLFKQLNFETRLLKIKNLDPKKEAKDWIDWIKKASTAEFYSVRSHLSESFGYQFDWLKMLSERVYTEPL